MSSIDDLASNVRVTSPRVKNATRLFLLGGAKNRKEAAELAGINYQYFSAMLRSNEKVKTLAEEIEEDLHNKSVDASIVLQKIGREAVLKITKLMESGSESIALKAAIDLADRSPEVQKVQRLEVASLSLDGQDAAELARALVESAKHREAYRAVATEGLVELTAQEASDARAESNGASAAALSQAERTRAET